MDRLAIWQDQIVLVSCAGPETTVKAMHALLCSNVKCSFRADDVKFALERSLDKPNGNRHFPNYGEFGKDPAGYDTTITRLAYNTWHLLAMTKHPGFLPTLEGRALEIALRSPRFTTPFLPEWVPWLASQMKDTDLIFPASFQCWPGVLLLDSQGLDELVSTGLRQGHLRIPEEEAA